MKKGRILTGDRPTGALHLGHYVGTLASRVRLQDENRCFFFVADWHALPSDYAVHPSNIERSTFDAVADWVAAGLDPAKS